MFVAVGLVGVDPAHYAIAAGNAFVEVSQKPPYGGGEHTARGCWLCQGSLHTVETELLSLRILK